MIDVSENRMTQKMNWSKLLSKKKDGNSASQQERYHRSEYHKDYDKIVFSSAFRRLGRKTQVHPLSKHDHVHTRLTHSIEVGCVGRTLGLLTGNFLKQSGYLPENILPEEVGAIVQAACMAHDIGNPPFGHAGEFAIRQWFKENNDQLILTSVSERNDLEIFEGNAQGFRLVSNIENDFNKGGLRLTYATLGTLIKYPWFSDSDYAKEQGKFNFFQTEKKIIEQIANELGLNGVGDNQYLRHPLSYLMETADDICYKILDIEDALALDILRYDDVYPVFSQLAGITNQTNQVFDDDYSNQRQIVYLRGKAMENLIYKSVGIFEKNYQQIISGDYHCKLLEEIGSVEQDGLLEIKRITKKNIFLNRRKIELEIGAYTTLETLLSAFITAINEFKSGDISFKSKRVLDLMGDIRVSRASSYHECYLRVTDLVAGMTDNHATHVANQLSGRAM